MISLQAAVLAMMVGGAGQAELLDFYADWCGPCRQMHPVVAQLAEMGYPVRQVNVDHDRSLAAQYQVQSLPTFVLVVDGREVDRVVGATNKLRLQRMFRKAGIEPGRGGEQHAASNNPAASRNSANVAPTWDDARAQSPDAPLVAVDMPGRPADAPLSGRSAPSFVPGEPMPAAPAESSSWAPPPRPQSAATTTPANAPPETDAPAGDLPAHLLAASVRLRVQDPKGHSVGSGTIVDARGGQALIVTCGHIFRDSKGQGRIEVDLFAPGCEPKAEGRLISYDLERDVALVQIAPGGTPPVVPLAAPETRFAVGDPVFNVGCNNGDDPTLRESYISGIDKYLGPPNIEAAGQPVEGRSGGGLFTADGRMIGVCNAADPADNEGLYAALASIHAELARAGLEGIGVESGEAMIADSEPARAPGRFAEPAELADRMPLATSRGPHRAAEDRQDDFAASPSRPPHFEIPTAAPNQVEPPRQAAGQFSAAEHAALAEIGAQAEHAEVICVIRPLNDPRAKTRIIVLDRASPAFLEYLAGERQSQDARHLTSLNVSQNRGAPAREAAAQTTDRSAASLNPNAWQPKWSKPGL